MTIVVTLAKPNFWPPDGVDRNSRRSEQVKYRLPRFPPRILALPVPPAHPLLCHPTASCPAVHAIAVTAELSGNGDLLLTFGIDADPAGLRLAADPADPLWQHTCCEAFVAAVDAPAYREFNFSPAGQWAAYDFSDYRQRTGNLPPAPAPLLAVRQLATGFRLQARLAAALLPAGQTFQLGLSAVVEAADGGKSYWALSHAGDRPDFHHRQSFILTLPRATP